MKTKDDLLEIIMRSGATAASDDGAELLASRVGATNRALSEVCVDMSEYMGDEVKDIAAAMLIGMQAGIMLMNEQSLEVE